MRKAKTINLNLPSEKLKVIQLMDKELLVGEFRTYYKSYLGAEKKLQIKHSGDLKAYLLPLYADQMEDSEKFIAVYLSRANTIFHYTVISSGGITGTVVDIQIILRHAILLNAKGICLCHNHPSGNLAPSDADIAITKKISAASKLMEITVIDHIILSTSSYYSFSDNGLL